MLKHSELTPSQKSARIFHYHRLRKASPDRSVAALWQSALAEVHFRADLDATVKAYKKRSVAAKRGWKARKAN